MPVLRPAHPGLLKWTINRYRLWWRGTRRKPPYNHCCQIGDPVLRRKAEPVNLETGLKEAQQLVKQMQLVMRNHSACGLSACQIGVPLSIIAMEFTDSYLKLYSESVQKIYEIKTIPFTAVINPELVVLDNSVQLYTEGCESMKGYKALVPRYRGVRLSGFNPEGEPIELDLVGWLARIAQHEMDHINGELYFDKMLPKSLELEMWDAVNQKGGKVDLRFSW
ncbi:unnamed protein product [Cyprideis torosa]|uniref:Peptide deformylase n=1 Tax=Cyprideis torosa TaxID=163714 RepID=A0A7R8WKW4_9CRUS|nr:unnamed protein product [Cyprideis torosa]CAG0897538.1 unnamed protein product [Cyprideis torosa]